MFHKGKAQVMRDDDARLSAYSIVDLSDDWVPTLFQERTAGKDDFRKNRYRATFIALANDREDEAGNPLPPGEHNYVELYGIPPSLSVVRQRFLNDVAKPCYQKLMPAVLKGYRGAIAYKGGKGARAVLDRYRELKHKVRRAMRLTGATNVNELKRRGKAFLVRQYRLYQTKLGVINQAQLRLVCEGLYRKGEKVRRMLFDHNMHRALARFERKHMLYGWGQLFGKTLRILARSPIQNDFETFRRVVTERVVHSLGIIEDGSAPLRDEPAPSLLSRRRRHSKRGPDLAGTYTRRLLEAMDLTTPDKVLRFFQSQPPERFQRFRVAVKLPPRPDYYGPDMRLEVVIDRGDVWYDSPYMPSGKRRSFPRWVRPSLTLYVRVSKSKRIPLVRYHTTIGGWNHEWKDGKEYLAYKGSDVGPRIWRDIVAGPVWIPPDTTPPRALVTVEKKGGRWIRRVRREEIGPSYASAYGLVAAYHIQQVSLGRRVGWKDNGIRTHGSVDYMSILTRYSHGCHRLHNHRALRLFSFILRHSHFVRRGQVPLAYAKRFTVKGKSYRIQLDTRGYYYTLRRPIPVLVTEGRIMGKQKSPIEHFVAIPGKTYARDDPNLQVSSKVESDAKDSQDGYAPTGALPPEPPKAATPSNKKPSQSGSPRAEAPRESPLRPVASPPQPRPRP